MVSRLLSLGLPLIALGCAGEAAETAQGPPQIHFESHRRSLGEVPIVPRGHPGNEARFVLVNRGLSPLHIRGLVNSCRCARSDVSSPVIEPGGRGFVSVFVSSQQAEEGSASVNVHSNDPARPVSVLSVSWRAIAPLEFQPLILDFGIVPPNQEQSRTVEVVRRGDGCPITGVGCYPDDRITARDQNSRIEVTLRPGSDSGSRSGLVAVSVSGCWLEELVIPVRWQVRAEIEATPAKLFLSAHPGAVCTQNVVVAARPGARLDVRSIVFRQTEPAARSEVERIAPERMVARIQWRVPDTPGLHENELVVTCDSAGERTLVVPVVVYVTGDEP